MQQGEIWRVNLNPSTGSEQAGIRPVVIISGNLLNVHLNVVIACPLSTKIKTYKGNVVLQPSTNNQLKEPSEILSFHIRSISKVRFLEKIGSIEKHELEAIKNCLNDLMRY
jgi:mRNA interferase MazF